MKEPLSRTVNFKLNHYPIVLGKSLDISAISAHGFKKAGFLARFFIKPSKHETLFWSGSCELTYLIKELSSIRPVPGGKKGSDTTFGTTAYLFYVNNKLSKFVFQITQNLSVAKRILEDLGETLVGSLGEPSTSSANHKTWEVENQKLMLELSGNSSHGFIHLRLNP